MNPTSNHTHPHIAAALRGATDTRELLLGDGVIDETADVFRLLFGNRPATIVADANTFEAAGRRVCDLFARAGLDTCAPFVFEDPNLHACYEHVEKLREALTGNQAIPVAVGSGTVNDITKLAAHESGRWYMVVATAASMDGYTAYGASINREGSKQTFFCPAPLAVVADMEIIARAPAELNAAGYGDLVAKAPAGADWMLADALGVEPIIPEVWSLVQDPLRELAACPEGIRKGDRAAIRNLTEGLMMTGFAMQQAKSSRPASGAEHQFSHLWDMQDHHHHGRIPLHGHKVAIGALASTRLYEELLRRVGDELDIDAVCGNWPGLSEIEDRVDRTHPNGQLRRVAREEMRAKYVTPEALRVRLTRLKQIWPTLQERLRRQLFPADQLRQMLVAAGAPCEPTEIGIDLERLRRSHIEAQQIRRRYTVLDLATETGLLSVCLERLFATDGPWCKPAAPSASSRPTAADTRNTQAGNGKASQQQEHLGC
ncbi:MAG TPA: sn-glycerol-1-phosphate dehydrogenase [Phycisphaerae bacterium]|nr:sn-glycerol-1-phosphate dehydrogenase [Phycisphaerae bacterium]